jgi:PBSX family phage terminase large subunit
MIDDRRFEAALRVMSRKQIRSVFEATARINIWHGAVSSGKTIASLLAFLLAVVAAPRNGLILIVGRTIQTVERNVIDVLMQPAGPFGLISRWVAHSRGSGTAVIFGRVVHLIGAHDVRAEGRIRGVTAALIYIDEVTLIPEGFFVMCLSRLRVPGARLLGTTNPDGPLHWLRVKFLLRAAELNLRQWVFDLEDNPSLTADYKQALRAEYVGLFYRRFILGQWCLAEGAIFDSFDPDMHVVDRLPAIERWIGLGVDYGTTNPFAAELLGLGSDGVLYAAAEWYYDSKTTYRQLSDDEYCARVLGWLDTIPIPGGGGLLGVRPQWTVVDPSAASFRVRLHQDGLPSVMADNRVLPGIRLMAGLLATQRLKIHASCRGLIAELPGYSWDPKAAEKGDDAPIKANDHAIDALRYLLLTTEGSWRFRLREPILPPVTRKEPVTA